MAETIVFQSLDRCTLHGNMLRTLLTMLALLKCSVSLHMCSRQFFHLFRITLSSQTTQMFLRLQLKCSWLLHSIAWDGMEMVHPFKILHG